MRDKNGVLLEIGDIIDIHKIFNGHRRFVVLRLEPLCVASERYLLLSSVYDVNALLNPCVITGESTWEIVGNIYKTINNNIAL